MKETTLPPAKERADLSLMRRLIGPAMLGMLPGIFGIGGRPGMFGMDGSGGIGALPADGGSWPGDLTADTSADMDTGETWETPKLDGGWLISAVEKFSFGKLEPVWKKNERNRGRRSATGNSRDEDNEERRKGSSIFAVNFEQQQNKILRRRFAREK